MYDVKTIYMLAVSELHIVADLGVDIKNLNLDFTYLENDERKVCFPFQKQNLKWKLRVTNSMQSEWLKMFILGCLEGVSGLHFKIYVPYVDIFKQSNNLDTWVANLD